MLGFSCLCSHDQIQTVHLWPEYWVFVVFRPFPTLCDFPEFYFLALGDVGLLQCLQSVHRAAGGGGPVKGVGRGSGSRGEGMKADKKSP